ncbi:MAG: N-acetylneuraminate synthase family protein [bacterium]
MADRPIGPGHPCLVIGEVAQAHDGSLGLAHAFIDAVADCGADAVKFQTHIAEAESTLEEPWRVPFSPQDVTRYDYWKRTAFSEEQWRDLKAHASQRHLMFLSSPFSIEAAELLQRVGVPAWKVPSGEATSTHLLDHLAATGLPLLLSTGMSPLAEVDGLVRRVRARGAPLVVLQGTSIYPTPPERVGLNLISLFRERYACPVGFSDHSGTIYPGLAAAALGIDVLEVHVTLSRQMFGPDGSSALTLPEVRQLVEGVRLIERMKASPVDKDALALELDAMRQIFGKSLVAGSDLAAGTVLRPDHLEAKKPGRGISASRMGELVGRRLRRAVQAGSFLREDDLEGA